MAVITIHGGILGPVLSAMIHPGPEGTTPPADVQPSTSPHDGSLPTHQPTMITWYPTIQPTHLLKVTPHVLTGAPASTVITGAQASGQPDQVNVAPQGQPRISDGVLRSIPSPWTLSHGNTAGDTGLGLQGVMATGVPSPAAASEDTSNGTPIISSRQAITAKTTPAQSTTSIRVVTTPARISVSSTSVTGRGSLATGPSIHNGNSAKIRIIVPAVVVPLVIAIAFGLYLLRRRNQRRRNTLAELIAPAFLPHKLFVGNIVHTNRVGVSKGMPGGPRQYQHSISVYSPSDSSKTSTALWLQVQQPENTQFQTSPSLACAVHLKSPSGLEQTVDEYSILGVSPSEGPSQPQASCLSSPTSSRLSPLIRPQISITQLPSQRCGETGATGCAETDNQVAILREKVERMEAALKESDRLVQALLPVDAAGGPPAYDSHEDAVVSNHQ